MINIFIVEMYWPVFDILFDYNSGIWLEYGGHSYFM